MSFKCGQHLYLEEGRKLSFQLKAHYSFTYYYLFLRHYCFQNISVLVDTKIINNITNYE